MNEVFVLGYDSRKVTTWILCGKYWKLHKDIIMLIAKKYLGVKYHHCYPLRGIYCSNIQQALFHRSRYSIVNTDETENIIGCVAGLIVLGCSGKVHVTSSDESTLIAITELVDKMSTTSISILTTSMLLGRSETYNVLILMDAEWIAAYYFVYSIMPMLYNTHVNVIICGRYSQSHFLRDLHKTSVNGNQFQEIKSI